MGGRVANCPNCGGGVRFEAGTSLLVVCPYCSSTVARVGGDITHLEITGRVAPLAPIASGLAVGTRGSFRGRDFTLRGRVQYDFGAGPWNEWYAAFDDGRWGWVAEAQGRAIVSFEAPAAEAPRFDAAPVGSHHWLHEDRFTVVEQREARVVSAEGELPFSFDPDARFRYCDLQGPGRAFATFDFGAGDEVEHVFLGEALDPSDLFDASVFGARAPEAAAAAVGLNCPNCGAGVELRAPDASMRVTCVRCDALLDCTQGSELFLLQSAQPPASPPKIPLGSQGRLHGDDYVALGHLVRSVTVEGVRYAWEEYLLRASDGRYRWLVESNGHWIFVEPVNAGAVVELGGAVQTDGQRFRHFTSGAARVDALRGEFYWKVQVGETVATADYVKPPRIVSKERSESEIHWSLGTYVDASEVRAAFRIEAPWPRPHGVAPAQPNPHRAPLRSILRAAAIFSAAAVLAVVGLVLLQPGWTVVDAPFEMDPRAGTVVATEPFELSGRGNLQIRATAPVENAWVYLDGALVHLDTDEVKMFGVEVSYYRGVSGGERWSEGSRTRTVYLGELMPGRYVLKLKPEGAPNLPPGPIPVRVVARSRVFLASHAVVLLLLLWLFPLAKTVVYLGFEKRRWAESDHAE